MIAKEDASRWNFKLPPHKDRLQGWKNEGETFPPIIDQRLTALVQAYRRLEASGMITATYAESDVRPWTGKDILGTCPAPALQAARSIMNGAIRNIFPAGSGRNQEQDPNRARRLWFEQGVELRRQVFDPNQSRPPDARTLTAAENLAISRAQAIESAMAHPLRTSLVFLAKLAGAGVSTLAEVGISAAAPAGNALRQYIDDYQSWLEHLDKLAASRQRVHSAVRDVATRHVLTHPDGPPVDSKTGILPVVM